MMNAFDLSGKRALVTGSSKGIGFSIAEALAQSGADIVLVARGVKALEQAKDRLQASGCRVSVYSHDMSDTEGIPALFDQILNDCGAVDILVNNAGSSRRGPAENIGSEDWNFVININLTSVFRLSQSFAKHCINESKPGKVINISSLMGEAVRKDNTPYAASKGGIRQLTKAMAVDWAKYHINVNAIGPGYIKTDLSQSLHSDPEFDRWVKQRTPAGRWGLPEDIGFTAVFLASKASDFITGQSIYVDGGILSSF